MRSERQREEMQVRSSMSLPLLENVDAQDSAAAASTSIQEVILPWEVEAASSTRSERRKKLRRRLAVGTTLAVLAVAILLTSLELYASHVLNSTRMDLADFTLGASDGSTFAAQALVRIQSPSSLSAAFAVDSLRFSLDSAGGELPLAQLVERPTIDVKGGVSETYIAGSYEIINEPHFELFAANALNNASVPLRMHTRGRVGADLKIFRFWLPFAISATVPVTLRGMRGLAESLALSQVNGAVSLDGVQVKNASFSFSNPAAIRAVVPAFHFHLWYKDTPVAALTTVEHAIQPGYQSVSVHGSIINPGVNGSLSDELVGNFFGGNDAIVRIQGNRPVKPQPSVLERILVRIIDITHMLPAQKPFSLQESTSNFTVLSEDVASVNISVEANLDNPTIAQADVIASEFRLLCKSQKVGDASVRSIRVRTGKHTFSVPGSLSEKASPDAHVVLSELFTRYLNNKENDIAVQVDKPAVLARVHANLTIGGLPGSIIQGAVFNAKALVASLKSLSLSVILSLSNPLPFDFSVTYIKAELYRTDDSTLKNRLAFVSDDRLLGMPADQITQYPISAHQIDAIDILETLLAGKECGKLCVLVQVRNGLVRIQIGPFATEVQYGCDLSPQFCKIPLKVAL